jgi:outer membrane protein OmpA-like peptidoglycan-associated protein
MTDRLRRFARMILGVLALALLLGPAPPALAQGGPFDRGWTLQPGASTLRFQSVKNVSVVESSGFATFSGQIDPQGAVELRILLDSVDTKIDLRNVRMRFLFFETFQFPEAVITTRIDPALLADLPTLRRKTMMLPFTLNLHGIARTAEAEVVVTLLGDDMVAVSSGTPISLKAADYGLEGGVKKLEEAAGVVIVPTATVTFDFVFARNGSGAPAAAPAAPAVPAQAALETATLDLEACKGRFEILSRSGNIYFGAGSARLDGRSAPLLNSLADIIRRCDGLRIEVSGHTDSDGSAPANQRLSEQRARAVARYLQSTGIAEDRLVIIGQGEDRPVVANDSAENKARNRRIEFAVVNG